MNYASFFAYVTITSFTPGPNNIIAMTQGSRHGFLHALRFCIGVTIGFAMVLSLGAAFSALLFNIIPQIQAFVSYIGAAYILYLAFHILRDTFKKENTTESAAAVEPAGESAFATEAAVEDAAASEPSAGTTPKRSILQPEGIGPAILFQFLNPKGIIYSITIMSAYILPNFSSIGMIALFVLALALIGFTSTVLWALLGMGIDRLLRKYRKGINIAMVLLLLYCAVTLVMPR